MNLTPTELELLSLALTDRLTVVRRRVEGDPHATAHDRAELDRVVVLLGRVRAAHAAAQSAASVDLLDSVLG